MKHIAVILAGGRGSRLGGETPKQLLPLEDGRTILEHAVDAFEQAACIDEIAIVMIPGYTADVDALCRKNGWKKLKRILAGGSERWESSWNAIQAFSCQNSEVLSQGNDYFRSQTSDICLWLHDAARPFVSQRILDDVAKALETHKAVTVAVPVTDTLYKVESLGLRVERSLKVESIPSRAEFMRAQTPQAFHLDVLKKAFERALKQGEVAATDDVGIVHAFMPEIPIFIVRGDEANKKITYKEDLNGCMGEWMNG